MRLNFTIETEKDHFEEVYSDVILNLISFGVYLIGTLSCIGLCYASWYEKSGQAGQFRTLVNQLVSHNLDSTVLGCCGYGIFNLRIIFGPMPFILCRIGNFAGIFAGMNITVISVCITVTKFYFVVIRQSIPIMNDNLIFAILAINTNVINFFAVLAKFYVEEKTMISEVLPKKPQNLIGFSILFHFNYSVSAQDKVLKEMMEKRPYHY